MANSFLIPDDIFQITGHTVCSWSIVFFSLKCHDFSKLCKFCCSAGILPAICRSKHEVRCTHTDAEGKQREARVQNIFLNFWKNTIFKGHPVIEHQLISQYTEIDRKPFKSSDIRYFDRTPIHSDICKLALSAYSCALRRTHSSDIDQLFNSLSANLTPLSIDHVITKLPPLSLSLSLSIFLSIYL